MTRRVPRRLRGHETGRSAPLSARARGRRPISGPDRHRRRKGQLEAAYEALESLGLANLVAIGLAKKEELIFTRDQRRADRRWRADDAGAAAAAADPRRGAPVCRSPSTAPRAAKRTLDLRAGWRAGAGAASPQAAAPAVRQPRLACGAPAARSSKPSSARKWPTPCCATFRLA